MLVMPGNHSSPLIHYWAGKYGEVGWLVSPKLSNKTRIRPWIPYALDNDIFVTWSEGKPWSERLFFEGLDRVRLEATREGCRPRWVAVPDRVADRRATLEQWDHYAPRVAAYGWPLAFVVQDGMTPRDIPGGADVVFVGGSTEWKWRTVEMWCETGRRVHVGRVNSLRRVWLCHDLGAESVDGTGWFRSGSDGAKMLQLEQYFRRERPDQMDLFAA